MKPSFDEATPHQVYSLFTKLWNQLLPAAEGIEQEDIMKFDEPVTRLDCGSFGRRGGYGGGGGRSPEPIDWIITPVRSTIIWFRPANRFGAGQPAYRTARSHIV